MRVTNLNRALLGGGRGNAAWNRQQQSGFTIVEQLTVAAIVLILAALIFTVTVGAKERAKIATDISNLHQLGLAGALYAEENEDRFPMSVRDLLTERKVDPRICVSPSDMSEEGLMMRFLKDLQLPLKTMKGPIPRCTYIGPGEGLWTWDSYKQSVFEGKNAGWLINLIRAKGRERVPGSTGPYQRLLLDTSVVLRHMGRYSVFIEESGKSAQGVSFGTYFCDEDWKWLEAHGK